MYVCTLCKVCMHNAHFTMYTYVHIVQCMYSQCTMYMYIYAHCAVYVCPLCSVCMHIVLCMYAHCTMYTLRKNETNIFKTLLSMFVFHIFNIFNIFNISYQSYFSTKTFSHKFSLHIYRGTQTTTDTIIMDIKTLKNFTFQHTSKLNSVCPVYNWSLPYLETETGLRHGSGYRTSHQSKVWILIVQCSIVSI